MEYEHASPDAINEKFNKITSEKLLRESDPLDTALSLARSLGDAPPRPDTTGDERDPEEETADEVDYDDGLSDAKAGKPMRKDASPAYLEGWADGAP